MIQSLTLITIYFQDLERARAFYTDTLGLEVAPQFSSETFIFLRLAGAQIALRPLADAPVDSHAGAGSVELNFVVDDVERTYADFAARGVEIKSEIGDVGVGRAFMARDPEGHLLTF